MEKIVIIITVARKMPEERKSWKNKWKKGRPGEKKKKKKLK